MFQQPRIQILATIYPNPCVVTHVFFDGIAHSGMTQFFELVDALKEVFLLDNRIATTAEGPNGKLRLRNGFHEVGVTPSDNRTYSGKHFRVPACDDPCAKSPIT